MAMTQERKRDFTQHWSSIKPMILNVRPNFQWPFQEPIDWRYRFHIFLVYFSGLNFKIQYSQELFGANLESNHWIQDSRFPGTLWSKSWIQPLDSRFKIPRNSLEQILNPSWILDSRFPAKSPWESWILNLESWIQDLLERVPRNLESWIQGLDSRFGFKICSKESLGILNLESIQLAMALQRHCKLDRCQRSQGSKKVGLGEGVPYIYIYICIKKRKNTYKTGYLEHVEKYHLYTILETLLYLFGDCYMHIYIYTYLMAWWLSGLKQMRQKRACVISVYLMGTPRKEQRFCAQKLQNICVCDEPFQLKPRFP